MKYILICCIALVICFLVGFFLSKLVTKKLNKKGIMTVILTIAFGIVLMLATTLSYLSIYYHATDTAKAALNGNQTDTEVKKTNGGYLFDGPGKDTALIFYPGAKVECEAYAPLMMKISENGIDCFLADMPFNFSVLGTNQADQFIESYDYAHWIMSGHSLGGSVAAMYLEDHPEQIDGLVLLASYPSSPLDQDVRLVSIYGSEDGCLDREEYEKSKAYWPDNVTEYMIKGGNHSMFGDYGHQDGDGEGLITPETQQKATAEYISSSFSDFLPINRSNDN